jgi:phosphatidylserine/phosphatidylglycerophosphate/cardiolipin synthase-like enzyme
MANPCLASSVTLMSSSEPILELGEYLTALEATGIAQVLLAGGHITQALQQVNTARRDRAKELMSEAGLGHADVDRSVAILQAITGAKAAQRGLTPVWTMPGNEADIGHLTGQFHHLVGAARQSITCATYNFQTTSKMWTVLKEASEQPGVVVVIYVDGEKADAAKVKAQIPKATIYRSAALPNGKRVVSHAKFVIIDHAVLLLTSANFSYSAENLNIEFGLRIHDPSLAASVESTMTSKHGTLYELV